MKEEPLRGDVVPLRGAYQGSFRRRVGAWRILFSLDLERRTVERHPPAHILDLLNSTKNPTASAMGKEIK
jgi:hypothetical protein